jgi:isocitrate/isopropylmalate dehydrogenase
MLLDYLGDKDGAGMVEAAVGMTISRGIRTRDLGGSAGTREFGDAVIKALGRNR